MRAVLTIVAVVKALEKNSPWIISLLLLVTARPEVAQTTGSFRIHLGLTGESQDTSEF